MFVASHKRALVVTPVSFIRFGLGGHGHEASLSSPRLSGGGPPSLTASPAKGDALLRLKEICDLQSNQSDHHHQTAPPPPAVAPPNGTFEHNHRDPGTLQVSKLFIEVCVSCSRKIPRVSSAAARLRVWLFLCTLQSDM